MKKLLSLLLLIPALVFAQSYPSPTYQNLTVNGTISGAGVTSLFASPPAIGGTAASTGAFTTLTGSGVTHLSNTSSGASVLWLTGNGATTPSKFLGVQTGLFTIQNNAQNSNIFTLTDGGNLTVTGSITPSTTGGIVGTTAGDNANAGSDGENPNSTSSSTGISTSTVSNLTSISLSAGDWDVEGSVNFNTGSGTTLTIAVAASSSTTGALPAAPFYNQYVASLVQNSTVTLIIPVQRFNVTTTTPVYLVIEGVFSGGTATAQGFIRARRMR